MKTDSNSQPNRSYDYRPELKPESTYTSSTTCRKYFLHVTSLPLTPTHYEQKKQRDTNRVKLE
jgi:hypothetical protein